MSASKSKLDKSIILKDEKKNIELKFNTVASLRRELKISDWTINRWAIDGKVYSTNFIKYPLIKIIKN